MKFSPTPGTFSYNEKPSEKSEHSLEKELKAAF
jgi:hypothetical protein